MRVVYTRVALVAAIFVGALSPAFAQHDGHQMPAAGAPASASVSQCVQNAQGVTRTIDLLTGRIEEARQTNDAAKIRTAVADLEVALAQMKRQLADCTMLQPAGAGAMGNMPGMDHSTQTAAGAPKMQPASPSQAPAGSATDHSTMPGMDHSKMDSAPKAERAPASVASAQKPKAAAPQSTPPRGEPSTMPAMEGSKGESEKLVFTLRTDPAPPRSGENDFEVQVVDAAGKPITDAEVSLAFFMPPMPSMNMPEMRNTVKLVSEGNGTYKGSGTIGMTGDWDVTISARRAGQALGTTKVRLTAK
jgi:hypothetical protein